MPRAVPFHAMSPLDQQKECELHEPHRATSLHLNARNSQKRMLHDRLAVQICRHRVVPPGEAIHQCGEIGCGSQLLAYARYVSRIVVGRTGLVVSRTNIRVSELVGARDGDQSLG